MLPSTIEALQSSPAHRPYRDNRVTNKSLAGDDRVAGRKVWEAQLRMNEPSTAIFRVSPQIHGDVERLTRASHDRENQRRDATLRRALLVGIPFSNRCPGVTVGADGVGDRELHSEVDRYWRTGSNQREAVMSR